MLIKHVGRRNKKETNDKIHDNTKVYIHKTIRINTIYTSMEEYVYIDV